MRVDFLGTYRVKIRQDEARTLSKIFLERS